jgi:hypothetical protein
LSEIDMELPRANAVSTTVARGSEMSTRSFVRLSGLVLVTGAVISSVCLVIGGFFFAPPSSSANQPLNVIAEFALAGATILVLLGLPGVYASRARGFGITGLFGIALVFAAAAMADFFGNLYAAMVEPWLATQAPNLVDGFGPPPFFAYYNIAEVLLVAGSILLAIPVLRGRVSPRWAGFALLLSVVVGVGTFFFDAFPSSLASGLLTAAAPIMLLGALVGLGYQAWSEEVGR